MIILLSLLLIFVTYKFFTSWVWWILALMIVVNLITWWDKLIDFLFGNLVTGLGIVFLLILYLINIWPTLFHKPTYWKQFKDNQVGVSEMAKDLKTSKQDISNHSHAIDTAPAKAVEYATYLHDPKFNQQMAAIYFEAISMFDPSKWAKQFLKYFHWFSFDNRLSVGC